MASRYYAIEVGEHMSDVTEGSSTGSKGIELVVDLAKVTQKQQVLLAMRELEGYILRDGWTPA